MKLIAGDELEGILGSNVEVVDELTDLELVDVGVEEVAQKGDVTPRPQP